MLLPMKRTRTPQPRFSMTRLPQKRHGRARSRSCSITWVSNISVYQNVKCQTSHVECQMYLSNYLLTKRPNDQLNQLGNWVVGSFGLLTNTYDNRHGTFDI